MNTRFFSYFLLCALASCTRGETAPNSGTPPSAQAGGGSAAGSAGATALPAAGSQQGNGGSGGSGGSGGKGTSGPPTPIVMLNTTSAKTDQPASPSVSFRASPQYNPDFRWEPLLTASVSFIDDRGNKIALSPELAIGPAEFGWPQGQLTPASPLELDRWYSLKIEPKGYYMWGSVDNEPFSSSTESVEIRLFTGSAPFLQKARLTLNSEYLALTFSETIEVSDALQGIEVWSGDQMVKGCLDVGGVCRQSDTVWQSSGVYYHLESYAGASIEIKVPSSIKGRTRTFGEAAALFGLPTDAAGYVTYQITWVKNHEGEPVWVHPRVETPVQ